MNDAGQLSLFCTVVTPSDSVKIKFARGPRKFIFTFSAFHVTVSIIICFLSIGNPRVQNYILIGGVGLLLTSRVYIVKVVNCLSKRVKTTIIRGIRIKL